MDDDKKKTVMIVLAVVCLALAGGIIYWTQFRSSSPTAEPVPVILKCLNCGYVKETNTRDMWEGLERPSETAYESGPPILPCPQCGKKAMVEAMKCPKCGEVFVPDRRTLRAFPDRCPKCKYSAMEEEAKGK